VHRLAHHVCKRPYIAVLLPCVDWCQSHTAVTANISVGRQLPKMPKPIVGCDSSAAKQLGKQQRDGNAHVMFGVCETSSLHFQRAWLLCMCEFSCQNVGPQVWY
jgi:hypothetical protein